MSKYVAVYQQEGGEYSPMEVENYGEAVEMILSQMIFCDRINVVRSMYEKPENKDHYYISEV